MEVEQYYERLEFIDKEYLELLKKLSYQIKSEFKRLNTSFDFHTEGNNKQAHAIFTMNNDYTIECKPQEEMWHCSMYKVLQDSTRELVFTFSFNEDNLGDIATTIKVFSAGTPTFKVNE